MSKLYKTGLSVYNLSKINSIHLGKTAFRKEWFIVLQAENSFNYDLNIKINGNKQYVNRIVFNNEQLAKTEFKKLELQLTDYLNNK